MSEVKKMVDAFLQPEDAGHGMVKIDYDKFVTFVLLTANACDISPHLVRYLELSYVRADRYKKKRIRKKKKQQLIEELIVVLSNLDNPKLK